MLLTNLHKLFRFHPYLGTSIWAIILRQSPVLFKLLQTTTVTEYQMQFEALSNRVEGMNLDLLLNFFLYLVYVWT